MKPLPARVTQTGAPKHAGVPEFSEEGEPAALSDTVPGLTSLRGVLQSWTRIAETRDRWLPSADM